VLWGSRLEARVGETEAGEGRTVVARGRGASARERTRRKARKRGKIGRRGLLPHSGTPAAARGDRGAAEVWRQRAYAARVYEARVEAAG
jgi:hypothetical protein